MYAARFVHVSRRFTQIRSGFAQGITHVSRTFHTHFAGVNTLLNLCHRTAAHREVDLSHLTQLSVVT